MAAEIGDVVQVVDRDPTPADQKAGLFYNHFRGLIGTVERAYDDGSVCVVVNHSSLSREALVRLKRAEKLIKPRWKTAGGETTEAAAPVESAPPEGGETESLSPEAQEFEDEIGEVDDTKPGLRYSIVLKTTDLTVIGKEGARAASARTEGRRVSESDLSAAEEQRFKELQSRG